MVVLGWTDPCWLVVPPPVVTASFCKQTKLISFRYFSPAFFPESSCARPCFFFPLDLSNLVYFDTMAILFSEKFFGPPFESWSNVLFFPIMFWPLNLFEYSFFCFTSPYTQVPLYVVFPLGVAVFALAPLVSWNVARWVLFPFFCIRVVVPRIVYNFSSKRVCFSLPLLETIPKLFSCSLSSLLFVPCYLMALFYRVFLYNSWCPSCLFPLFSVMVRFFSPRLPKSCDARHYHSHLPHILLFLHYRYPTLSLMVRERLDWLSPHILYSWFSLGFPPRRFVLGPPFSLKVFEVSYSAIKSVYQPLLGRTLCFLSTILSTISGTSTY